LAGRHRPGQLVETGDVSPTELLDAAIGELAPDPAAPLAASVRAIPFATFTTPWNLTGQPAISLPLHRTPEGLPVGVQLVAASGREDVLLGVAAQLEQARPWSGHRPTGRGAVRAVGP
jgi:amidase